MSVKRPRGASSLQAALLSEFNAPQNTNRALLLEAERLLRRAVQNELTDRQRTCLLLYYGERRTMQEIAAALGLTRGTVSKHIRKATDRLHRALQYSALGMKILR